jgi:hypothetical protein
VKAALRASIETDSDAAQSAAESAAEPAGELAIELAIELPAELPAESDESMKDELIEAELTGTAVPALAFDTTTTRIATPTRPYRPQVTAAGAPVCTTLRRDRL